MRQSWDDYFLDLAQHVSTRGTCTRLQVGSVIVDQNNRIISTGYNGAPKGLEHCIDVGCMKNSEGRCIRTIHSEVNAILNTENKSSLVGSTLYCTHEPCENCMKAIIQVGIKKVVFKNKYSNEINSYWKEFIELIHKP